MLSQVIILCLVLLVPGTHLYTSPSSCSSLYNYLTHSCQTCPANTAISTDIGFCNCTGQYYPNPQSIGFMHSQSCLDFGVYIPISSVRPISKPDHQHPKRRWHFQPLNCDLRGFIPQLRPDCLYSLRVPNDIRHCHEAVQVHRSKPGDNRIGLHQFKRDLQQPLHCF